MGLDRAGELGSRDRARRRLPVYAYATHIAEVEVDVRTGETRVVDVIAVHDSGGILNRALAAGQVEGGIAQGIGFALMEGIDVKRRPAGRERVHDLPHSDHSRCPSLAGRRLR